MGKIRAVTLGDEKVEKKAKAKAEARRQTKASKKGKDNVVEGTELKPEYQKLVNEVESGETVEETAKKQRKRKKRRSKYDPSAM